MGWRFFNETKPCGDGIIIAVKKDACNSHGPTIVVLWSIRPENDTLMTGFSMVGKGTS